MSDTRLGTIIDSPNPQRDAIHIAIAPVTSDDIVYPAQEVGLVKGSTTKVSSKTAPIGIVDPFLKTRVMPGQVFYVCLFQQTVTGMRHDWQHPAFGPVAATSASTATPVLPKTSRKKTGKSAAPAPESAPVTTLSDVELSEGWLKNYADEIALGYDELISAAKDYVDHEEYLVDGGKFEGVYLERGFWDHYEVVTGTVVPEEKRGSFFSCSC